MTEEKAIELATQYQKEDGRPTKLLGVRKITQAQIDAFEEAHGKKDPSERPEWMRLEPHWVVAFDQKTGARNFFVAEDSRERSGQTAPCARGADDAHRRD